MRTPLPAAAAAMLLAGLLTGCATLAGGTSADPSPAGAEASEDASSESAPEETTEPASTMPAFSTEPAAAWIDRGHSIAIVTWGSSTCEPVVGEVSASGQTIDVEFVVEANQVCTSDLTSRPTYVTVPAGVDRAAPAELRITEGDEVITLTLDAAADASGVDASSQTPTAARVGEDMIVILTWGSSSCPPVVADVAGTNPLTVTFAAQDGACTKDLKPRLTDLHVAGVPEGASIVLEGLDGATALQTITLEG